MSGHSKWSTIKRQKGLADAKRGQRFTKLGNVIAIAARSGADPETNFQLRLAIERARGANMPNENIQRAIERGVGKAGGASFEEITYEGFGPGGAAVLVQAATDNRNRTTAEIRRIFSEHNGNLGTAGSVAWMFEPKGIIRVSREAFARKSVDDLTLQLIDAGAEDVQESSEGLTIVTEPTKLEMVKSALTKAGIEIAAAGVESHPKTTTELTDQRARQHLTALLAALEEHDDVTDYATNAAL